MDVKVHAVVCFNLFLIFFFSLFQIKSHQCFGLGYILVYDLICRSYECYLHFVVVLHSTFRGQDLSLLSLQMVLLLLLENMIWRLQHWAYLIHHAIWLKLTSTAESCWLNTGAYAHATFCTMCINKKINYDTFLFLESKFNFHLDAIFVADKLSIFSIITVVSIEAKTEQ